MEKSVTNAGIFGCGVHAFATEEGLFRARPIRLGVMTLRIISLTLLSISAFTTAPALAADITLKDSVPHITMVGSARAYMAPDEATLSIGVLSERPTAQDASAETAKVTTRMLDALKAQGVATEDIQTTAVHLIGLYNQEHDSYGRSYPGSLRGYQATADFSIHVREAAKAGRFAQILIDAGANQFQGITFLSSKERETRRKLQGDAMRDALAEAQSYTNAIGVKLGRVIQIGGDDSQGGGDAADLPSRRPTNGGNTPVSVSIPMQPGLKEVSTSVAVTWEIESKS